MIQAVCDGADVAIDDIKFTNEKCSVYPQKASPTASPTKPGLTSVAPTVGMLLPFCNVTCHTSLSHFNLSLFNNYVDGHICFCGRYKFFPHTS